LNQKIKYELSMAYHENTKKSDTNYSFNSKVVYKVYPNTKYYDIEKNTLGSLLPFDDTFLKTLLHRKSTRSFSNKGIGLADISKLLSLSCGLRGNYGEMIFRTYPSAGARFPIEIYLVILNSLDMDLGLYHYNIIENRIELVRNGDFSKEVIDFYGQQQIETEYPCLILCSANFDRTMSKYGERGYRYVLIDLGHISQNFYLVSTYLGLGVVAFGVGSTSDDTMDSFLRLNSNTERFLYGLAVGYPQI